MMAKSGYFNRRAARNQLQQFDEQQREQEQQPKEKDSEQVKDYNFLLERLGADYEPCGYRAALSLSEESMKEMEIEDKMLQLFVIIEQVQTHYVTKISAIEAEIAKMSKLAMDDSVRELEAKKSMFNNYLNKIKNIEEDAKKGAGLAGRIKKSIEIGFYKGIKATSQFISNN